MAKVVWRIENFSKLINQQQLHSDTFSFNGRKWRMVINPKPNPRYLTHLTVFLCPVNRTESVAADYTLAIIDQKDDSRTVKRENLRHEFNNRNFCCGTFLGLSELHNPDNGYLLNDTCIVELEITKPKSIVEDYLDNLSPVDSMFFLALSCFLVSYVACAASVLIGSYKLPIYIDTIWIASFAATLVSGIIKFLPNDFVTRDQTVPSNIGEKTNLAPSPAKGVKLVSNTDQFKVAKAALEKKHETECENHKFVEEKTQGKEQDKASETEPAGNQVASPEVGLVKHLGAGQIFEGGIHNKYNQAKLLSDGDVFEEIGGFLVQRAFASLYKQIWLKYGHIASSHVLTASSELSYIIQIAAVDHIMHSLMDMSCCRFVEVTSEMIVLWEGDIKTADNLRFNIEWLRKHFDTVKQGFDEMQKLKTTLQEEVQPIKDAKAQVTVAEDELKKVQEQLTIAKDELKEKISALAGRVSPMTLSESEFEMYLEKGDTLLFDGVF
ncbi:hypothetical protein C5167_045500 [Papaver somniferum]|uniref:MATH domain-containing protein n=1 Tax=Papaver somniferum TaxID=3469 RepID=A0A4Y7LB33_PAPSO|nr:hypothetical protein C5167_045500 [Papaver somniferum]